jgi:hypothetical protein
VQQRNLGVAGRIFAIDNVRNKTGRGSSLKLRVNFLPEIIQLSKEVRNLKNLGFRVPLAIVNKAHQVKKLQPYLRKMKGVFLQIIITIYEMFYRPINSTLLQFL